MTATPSAETPSVDPAVRRQIDVDADPVDVWDAIVDDDRRAAWFGGPTTLDVSPGGHGTFVDPDDARRVATVDEVIPGRHLSWTWRTAGCPDDGHDHGESRVEIDLEPLPDGTRIIVTEAPVGHGSRLSALASAAGPLVGLELHLLVRHTVPLVSVLG